MCTSEEDTRSDSAAPRGPQECLPPDCCDGFSMKDIDCSAGMRRMMAQCGHDHAMEEEEEEEEEEEA